ncbi:hypothetical protein [Zhihengliuella flava]|uniref:Uncharacterized protein n=1 Tax=Zhihengliuella flava TaxID=1285193 RepID=A0A931D6G4_9MICC|nr:hypothetical protein [Zhihengliuella flava]MBG6083272.1 hypothetical protein [Zhihengliuella flava]
MDREYIVTFGQKYRRLTHPADSRISPDVYITIIADSIQEAYEAAFRQFGQAFAFVHKRTAFRESELARLHPGGELTRYTATPTRGRLPRTPQQHPTPKENQS